MAPEGAMQGSSTAVVFSGSFHPVAHPGMGNAEIVQAPDGSLTLRFRNFETDAGPNLEVYLVAAEDPMDSQSVIDAGYVTLGALQSASGDQVYDVPAGLDLDVYRSVTVWCVPFSVNFTTAPLRAGPGH
jgi:hypothetical protein